MNLRHRPMQPDDIPECVDIIANHPVIGPRYGRTIDSLREAWRRLLRCEAHNAMVFFTDKGLDAPICFFGITAIVSDDFLHEMKVSPHFWFGPELTRRTMTGKAPVLSDKELREANSGEGLNLLCWEGCCRTGYESHSELHHYMMAVFIQVHQGYLWKEVIANQAETGERLSFFLQTGAALWEPRAGCYTSKLPTDPAEIASKPHVLGSTRELERAGRGNWGGTWVGALFDYRPPVLGFSRSEQRLLSSALPGATDEYLAEILDTSLPAVKKSWVSIYRRVEDCLPELIASPLPSDIPAIGRGREKRRRLLTYLRAHPEELRPVSRKLLGKAAPG